MGKALIIIDVQNALFEEGETPIYKAEAVLSNINTLIEKARAKSVPIVFVQHNSEVFEPMKKGSHGWEIHEALDFRETDYYVDKTTPSAFYKTNLKDLLDQLSVNELVICGLQTDFCVDTTIRCGHSIDYDITVAKDGHSTMDSHMKAEDIIIHQMIAWGNWFAKLINTQDIQF